MNFYKRFIGDIQRKTGDLSCAEMGVYDRLLDHYYANEGPLPDDINRLRRIAGAVSPAERRAVDSVLAQFFELRDGAYYQKRADEEIADAQPKIAAAKANGKLGGRPKKAKQETQQEPTGFPVGTQQETQQEPSRKASQSQSREEENSVAIATAADAAPASPEGPALTTREQVWSLGVALLGDGARGLLGKLAKAHGEDVLAEVLAEATLNPPVEPKAWVMAACAKRAQPKAGGGQSADVRSGDSRPEWAIRAGFPDRFQAENAGCGPGNARQFRNGQRVAA